MNATDFCYAFDAAGANKYLYDREYAATTSAIVAYLRGSPSNTYPLGGDGDTNVCTTASSLCTHEITKQPGLDERRIK